MTIAENTKINTGLVLEFFLTLSKLEYALKNAGYFLDQGGRVDPHWDKFANDVSPRFNSGRTHNLEQACIYYLYQPPYKQIVENGYLSWTEALPNNGSELQNILVLVRRVRNNLFHGGKFNPQHHDETERNELLLSFGITILEECVRLSPEVCHFYEMAAI